MPRVNLNEFAGSVIAFVLMWSFATVTAGLSPSISSVFAVMTSVGVIPFARHTTPGQYIMVLTTIWICTALGIAIAISSDLVLLSGFVGACCGVVLSGIWLRRCWPKPTWSRQRFRFSLRSLLFFTLAFAVLAGIIGQQLVGRIQREGDRGFFTDLRRLGPQIDFGKDAGELIFLCASEGDARELTNVFDCEAFRVDVALAGQTEAPHIGFANDEFCIRSMKIGKFVLVKYDFEQWGRYRLNAQRLTYELDINDPLAARRNAAVHSAFKQAGERFAEKNPAIVEWDSSP